MRSGGRGTINRTRSIRRHLRKSVVKSCSPKSCPYNMPPTLRIVLASSSKYRRELLARLALPFDVASPDVDETALPGEAPQDTARRLAEAKARAVAARFPRAIVIGSDQVAVLEGTTLGKPGNHANAVRQLKAMRTKEVVFHTALCVCNATSGQAETRVVPFCVRFRNYSDCLLYTSP